MCDRIYVPENTTVWPFLHSLPTVGQLTPTLLQYFHAAKLKLHYQPFSVPPANYYQKPRTLSFCEFKYLVVMESDSVYSFVPGSFLITWYPQSTFRLLHVSEFYSSLCLHNILLYDLNGPHFISSCISGNLGCFYFFATVNNASVKTDIGKSTTGPYI